MNINILAHLKALEADRVVQVAKHQSEIQTLEANLKANFAWKIDLENEKQKKEKVLADALNEGLDTSKLVVRIGDLGVQIAEVVSKNNALQKQLDEPQKIADFCLDRAVQLAGILKDAYQCEEAVQINDIDDCWANLSVSVKKLDDAGRPLEGTVSFGQNLVRNLAIKVSNRHFSKGFRPEVLKWLPVIPETSSGDGQTETIPNHPAIYSFLDRKGQLILSQTIFEWTATREVRHEIEGRSFTRKRETATEIMHDHRKDDFADIAISLVKRFDETLAQVKGGLDLDSNYEGNRLMQHLRDAILLTTTPQPQYEPASEELTSAEIYQTIKIHWDNLASCPWSRAVQGDLALLKYYVENGEKARFWIEGFKNHYGFRLRTRDHSWITGHLYVFQTKAEAFARPTLKFHTSRQPDHPLNVTSLGNMWLTVHQSKD